MAIKERLPGYTKHGIPEKRYFHGVQSCSSSTMRQPALKGRGYLATKLNEDIGTYVLPFIAANYYARMCSVSCQGMELKLSAWRMLKRSCTPTDHV